MEIDLILKKVEDGDFNPLEAYILIKKSIEEHTQALSVLQKEAYDEADKYTEKTIKEYEGFIIEKSNTGARYNWSQDDIYKELETKLKKRQELLKTALKTDEKIFESDGSELIRVEIKTPSKSIIKVKILDK